MTSAFRGEGGPVVPTENLTYPLSRGANPETRRFDTRDVLPLGPGPDVNRFVPDTLSKADRFFLA